MRTKLWVMALSALPPAPGAGSSFVMPSERGSGRGWGGVPHAERRGTGDSSGCKWRGNAPRLGLTNALAASLRSGRLGANALGKDEEVEG